MDKQPIEELFPELMGATPKSEKWADLPLDIRRNRMEHVMVTKMGHVLDRRVTTPQLTLKREAALLEWSLRNGTLHPGLPVKPLRVRRYTGPDDPVID